MIDAKQYRISEKKTEKKEEAKALKDIEFECRILQKRCLFY